jgi:hypothetical protein
MLWLPRQFFRRFLAFQDKAVGARICLAIWWAGQRKKNPLAFVGNRLT